MSETIKRDWNEAHILVNGARLTPAQAMTVRVALQVFAMTLDADGLGNDDTGRAISAGYLRAVGEINKLLVTP